MKFCNRLTSPRNPQLDLDWQTLITIGAGPSDAPRASQRTQGADGRRTTGQPVTLPPALRNLFVKTRHAGSVDRDQCACQNFLNLSQLFEFEQLGEIKE